MNAIRSHESAYILAETIDAALDEGQSININFIVIRKDDGNLLVTGQAHKVGTEQKYTPSELADFVFFPERKRVNDWLSACQRDEAESEGI